eukprot:TRINITY_DN5974_c0_g1_i1.p1 TRINITY_DN5974_c0_g1~~TRINITY_DN5974_c0_g1_i1.p1  ORF type:complete len:140 (-),score=34.72 TRINITY_DN5974_c0_g1_i1:419-838(-)
MVRVEWKIRMPNTGVLKERVCLSVTPALMEMRRRPRRRGDQGDDAEFTFFLLKNNTNYRIELRNWREVKTVWVLFVDGAEVAKVLVDAWGTVVLERPVNINQKFFISRDEAGRRHRIEEDRAGEGSSDGTVWQKFICQK